MKSLPPAKERSREEKLRAEILLYARGCGKSSMRFARLMKLFEQAYPNLEPIDNAADAEDMGMTTPADPKPSRNSMRNKAYFANLLFHSYAQVKASDKSIASRLNYLSDYIFKFTTYDSEMGEFFVAVALEVAAAITDNATAAFIDNSDMHHKWYLVMVNMPFFSGRLDWGCSVRNAWWCYFDGEYTPETLGLYEDGEQLDTLELTRSEWIEFIKGMLIFAQDELEQLNVLAQLDC